MPIDPHRSSRLSGFYQKSVDERSALVAQWVALTDNEQSLLRDALTVAQADSMVENVIGRFALPLGIATNFLINGHDYLIPMVVEEPSVVAGVSYAAKLALAGGGFRTGSTPPVMVAQIQLIDVPDPHQAEQFILQEEAALLALANTSLSITSLGGGPQRLAVRHLPSTPTGPMLIIHLFFDTRDAMGANAINTAAETIAPRLEELSGGRALLRILSNLTDQRRAWAEVVIPAQTFATPNASGEEVVENIAHANAFAVADPYRAATHNKGIMNGIDAVAVATGNDWRAIEAGAHAWAARTGRYSALTEWQLVGERETRREGDKGAEPSEVTASPLHPFTPSSPLSLRGRLELPLAVGVVGGATRAHPLAQVTLKILGVQSARELSEVMAAVGLAQNLAALRALVTDGIQRGHMRLHARKMNRAENRE
jgi:hydroxymethylglutaryl-CoA reductase